MKLLNSEDKHDAHRKPSVIDTSANTCALVIPRDKVDTNDKEQNGDKATATRESDRREIVQRHTICSKCVMEHESKEAISEFDSAKPRLCPSFSFCCLKKRRNEKCAMDSKGPQNKLIAWSILRNVRFMSFVVATFCLTLPSNVVFLPALATSKGCSG